LFFLNKGFSNCKKISGSKQIIKKVSLNF